MIDETKHGDVFGAEEKHITFAVNTNGYNDSGFAGVVAMKYWPGLEHTEPQELGTVMSHETEDGRVFHALVCHSLNEDGWGADQTETIRKCFDAIPADEKERIASIAIGTGMIGVLSGADWGKIREGMEQSEKKIVLYE